MKYEVEAFTDQQLGESLFYPACGTDIQPVLMAADKVETFVYADWNRSEEEVVEAFRNLTSDGLQLLETHPVPQELYGRACLRTFCKNPRSRHFRRHVMDDSDVHRVNEVLPLGFHLTEPEIAAYDHRRRTASGVMHPWAREFAFQYTGGNRPRELKLVYFSDEGLARYCLLYLKHGVAPKFVCTIQSGPGFGHGWTMLEEPGGRFEDFMLACKPRPRVWIRKVWPDRERGGHWNQRLAECSFGRIQAFTRGEIV